MLILSYLQYRILFLKTNAIHLYMNVPSALILNSLKLETNEMSIYKMNELKKPWHIH